MPKELPDYYFRVREQGAAVYRVVAGDRLDLVQIAVANVKRGDWKPQGDTVLTPEDEAAIGAWLAQRQAALADRRLDEVHRTVEHLNMTAGWAQSTATDEELDTVSDALLLAMHDLRGVLVRRKGEKARAARS